MIYLDNSNTMLLSEHEGHLYCVAQDEAAAGANWSLFEGDQKYFDSLIRCQAPIDRIPAHLREDKLEEL